MNECVVNVEYRMNIDWLVPTVSVLLYCRFHCVLSYHMIRKVVHLGPRGSVGQGQSHKVIFAVTLCLTELSRDASLYIKFYVFVSCGQEESLDLPLS